ncbi:hypothetical protein AB8P51_04720 [Muriicola sp. SD30]|uniref:hypothetical protein n=1 Tax=Muriicola sp. SD30 TaxID=3240936 RepID=UPI00350FAD79
MYKFILKSAVFSFLFLALNFCYLFIIQKVDWNFAKRIEALNLENPRFDVLILGNSLAMDGVDTDYMSKKNLSSYNLALGGSSISTSLIQLKEYLTAYSYKPKYVIVGHASYTSFMKKDKKIHPAVDFTSENKVYGIYDLPMIKFKWMLVDNLKKLISKPHREAFLLKGQLKFKKKVADNTSLRDDNELNLDFYKNNEVLNEFIELCSYHNIQVFFVEMPGFKDERHPKKFNCKILNKESKNGFLIDYNTIVFGKIFDSKEDWIGADHLNESGARKFTEELVQDLFINKICGPNTESIEYN